MPTDLLMLLSTKNFLLFVIVFTRLSGMISTAPLISKYSIPIQIKTWFMATVAFIIFPILVAQTGLQIPNSIPALTVILLKEFFIGYIIGFVANLIFIAVEIAADLVSMQMGLTAAQAMNPMTGDTSSILTQAYTILASIIFLGINGYYWVFTALYKTFTVFPPSYDINVSGHFTRNVIYLTSQIFSIGIGIALPIFSVLLITDILLGFVAKMMPKMNIFMVAMPVKIAMGLILFIMLIQPLCVHIKVLLSQYLSGIITIMGG